MKRSLNPNFANNLNRQHVGSKTSFKSLKINTQTSIKSVYSKSYKTSVRKLLQDKVSLQEKKRQFTLNLTYKDIQVKKMDQITQQIQNFLCYKGILEKQKTCRCFSGKKCQWIVKWLSMILQTRQLTKQIDIDLQRTSNQVCLSFPEIEFKQVLKKTLIAYCSSDPQVNYLQGFNYLAASIVVHSKNYPDSYRIFSYLMKQKKLRQIYLDDFYIAKKHSRKITQTLKIKSYLLYIHTFKLGIDLDMFILGWLIPLFSNIISQEFMHLVIDNFLLKGWIFVYSLCLTILVYFREEILQMAYQEDILVTLSVQNILSRSLPWFQIIQSSINFPISKTDIYKHDSQTSTVVS